MLQAPEILDLTALSSSNLRSAGFSDIGGRIRQDRLLYGLHHDLQAIQQRLCLGPRVSDFPHSRQTAQLLGHREHTRSRRTAQPDLQAILIRSRAVLNTDVLQAQMGCFECRFNSQHGELPAINDQNEEARLSRTGEASLQRFHPR